MEDLRFTVERSQLRGLRIYTAVAAAAAVALGAAWQLSRSSGQVGMLALVAGLGAALGAYSWAAYARAFTECTPAGLRTRGLGGLRESTWPRITDIGLRPYGRGAVGMALSGPNTGGSQYFITHSAQPHLDGIYTIFARVVGGGPSTAVLNAIGMGDRIRSIHR